MDATPSEAPVDCTAAESAAPAQSGAESFEPPLLEAWEVTVECFRCKHGFDVPYKHLRSGTVLRCPACKGSYVIRAELYNRLRQVLPALHQRLREQCEALRAAGRPASELMERWRSGVEESAAALRRIVAEVRPAGAPRARAGMFG